MEVTVTADVELDDFEMDDILDYVEDNGYTIVERGGSSCSVSEVRDITKMCEALSSYGRGFYRELLADILFIPCESSDERILEGVKELLKR